MAPSASLKFRLRPSVLLGFAAWVLCVPALAQDAGHYRLEQAASYKYSRQLFSSWSFDTGWKPSSGPIQVKFSGGVGGGMKAQADGTMKLDWSNDGGGRTFEVEGRPDGGYLTMDMGVELHARMKLSLSIPPNIHYTWEDNIPYVPNFDYRLNDTSRFTPFLLPGQVPNTTKVHDAISPKTLYKVSLTQAFIPIPGISGDFELRVGGSMDSTLTGKRVYTTLGDIDRNNEKLPWGIPTTSQLDVNSHYEGTVEAQATLALEPAVVVHVGPFDWDLAKFDLPIALPKQTDTWVFSDVGGTFGLPRLELVLDNGGGTLLATKRSAPVGFTDEAMGTVTERAFTLKNTGKAALTGHLVVQGAGFELKGDPDFIIAPGAATFRAVRFTRPGVGSFAGLVSVDCSDPLGAMALTLTGDSHVAEPLEAPMPEAPPAELPPDDRHYVKQGCGCGAGSQDASLAAMLGLVLLARRRARRLATR